MVIKFCYNELVWEEGSQIFEYKQGICKSIL